MMLKMPFEMRNLTSFPMEKLCYDLKLEVLEGMDAKDTLELVKVNAGFQWMLSRNPSLVFNLHVNGIQMNECLNRKFKIRKFSVSDYIDASHLPLSKRIHSCDILVIRFGTSEYGGQLNNEHATILNQLNFVRNLELIWLRKESLLKFLDNFRSMIEKYAWIHLDIDWLKENQVVSGLLENFILNQLNDCEKVIWCYYDRSAAAFHFYYDAFAKTSIEILGISTKVDNFEEIVQSIVEKGIPSKNSKAAFHVARVDDVGTDVSQEMKARIVDFLSQFRGMKRYDVENQQEVMKRATEVVNKYGGGSHWFPFDGPFFRRNIDSGRDCVYMLPWRGEFNRFFAFYIEPQ